MKVVFATFASAEYQGRTLNLYHADRRLVSYFHHKEMKKDPIVEYAENGVCKEGKK